MTSQELKEKNAVEYLRKQIDFGNPEVVLRIYNQIVEQDLFETEVGLGFMRELRDFLQGGEAAANAASRPDSSSSELSSRVQRDAAGISASSSSELSLRVQRDAAGISASSSSELGLRVQRDAAGISASKGYLAPDEFESADTKSSATETQPATSAADKRALEHAATREALRHEAERIVKRERELSAEYQKKMYIAIVTAVIFGVMMIAMVIITLTSNLPTIINYRSKIVDEYAQWESELNEKEQALREYEEQLRDREEALQNRQNSGGQETGTPDGTGGQELVINEEGLEPLDENLFKQNEVIEGED